MLWHEEYDFIHVRQFDTDLDAIKKEKSDIEIIDTHEVSIFQFKSA